MPLESVLIVDDHAAFRAVARMLLAEHGFTVVGDAADGRSALESAAVLRPQLVVLDVQLPDLDGFEVCRRLLLAFRPPRVVLVSTREAVDYGGRIAASGAAGFITKSRLSGDTLRAILGGHGGVES